MSAACRWRRMTPDSCPWPTRRWGLCFFFQCFFGEDGCFQKIGMGPENGWWKSWKTPIEMDDLGISLFSETSICIKNTWKYKPHAFSLLSSRIIASSASLSLLAALVNWGKRTAEIDLQFGADSVWMCLVNSIQWMLSQLKKKDIPEITLLDTAQWQLKSRQLWWFRSFVIGCPHRFIAARTHVASISIIVLNALALSRSWRRPGFKIHRPTGQPLEIHLGPSFGSSRHCLSWLSLQCLLRELSGKVSQYEAYWELQDWMEHRARGSCHLDVLPDRSTMHVRQWAEPACASLGGKLSKTTWLHRQRYVTIENQPTAR